MRRFTPYELGILLHYYCRADEHEKAPIFERTIQDLIALDLMADGFAWGLGGLRARRHLPQPR